MIKFLDLKEINKKYEFSLKSSFHKVLDSGWFILGEEVKKFENKFAAYCQSKYCVGVGSGLDALKIIFQSYIELGTLKMGDEVIVPANTYIASIIAISEVGLKPVLVEPSIESYNLNITMVEAAINEKTRAVLCVHLYGLSCNMTKMNALAMANDLLVIEDCAQAHGAEFDGVKVGSTSNAGAFSFYPGKNLGALGDAGAITTSDFKLYEMANKIRNYGSIKKYHNDVIGMNSRLDEIQAGFLNIKLPYLDEENIQRIKMAKYYDSFLKSNKITKPVFKADRQHVYHLYTLRVNDREDFQKYMSDNQIETLIHYPIPPHKQKAYECWSGLSLPVTEKIHKEIISIPMSMALLKEEQKIIVDVINNY